MPPSKVDSMSSKECISINTDLITKYIITHYKIRFYMPAWLASVSGSWVTCPCGSRTASPKTSYLKLWETCTPLPEWTWFPSAETITQIIVTYASCTDKKMFYFLSCVNTGNRRQVHCFRNTRHFTETFDMSPIPPTCRFYMNIHVQHVIVSSDVAVDVRKWII